MQPSPAQSALAQIDRAYAKAPYTPSKTVPAKYVAPKPSARHYVPAAIRDANLAGLARFVDASERMVAGMSPDAARACLDANAELLNIWLGQLGSCNPPRQLAGLTAFDLSNARDQLMADPYRARAADVKLACAAADRVSV